MKCCAVLVTCMEILIEDDGYHFTLERRKVRNRKFIGVHKGIWVGLRWITHSKERLTADKLSSLSGQTVKAKRSGS